MLITFQLMEVEVLKWEPSVLRDLEPWEIQGSKTHLAFVSSEGPSLPKIVIHKWEVDGDMRELLPSSAWPPHKLNKLLL